MSRSRALSPPALAVVALLAGSEGWCHGYDITAKSGVKSGTLYPLLMRLEAQGLLEACWLESPQAGRPARHAYRLTPAGRDWVAGLADALAAVRAAPKPAAAPTPTPTPTPLRAPKAHP